MNSYVIGIDAGCTVTKSALFDLHGNEIACARRSNKIIFPNPGWTERDATAMLEAAAATVKSTIEQAGIKPRDVLAISVTGYGSGLDLLDRNGDPVISGILPTDVRGKDIVAEWRADGRAETLKTMIQQSSFASQSLVLLAWLQRHAPEVLDKTHRVLFCKDVLRAWLCGDFSTDYTDAGTAGLLDCHAQEYSEDAMRLVGVEAWLPKLPQLGHATDLVGGVSAQGAAQTGLLPGTPVVRGAVDMCASALAANITRPQEISVIAGTFSVVTTLHTKEPKTDVIPKAQFPYAVEGWMATEGSATSASNLDWLVKTLLSHGPQPVEGTDIYDIINDAVERAAKSPSQVMFFPYLFGGPDAPPASLLGMTVETGFDEIMHAVFEGIGFAHKNDVFHALRGPHAVDPSVVRFTGGASRSRIWPQMFADILNLPVEVPNGAEFGSLGAAVCAAAAVGGHGSLKDSMAAMTGIARRYEVNSDQARHFAEKHTRYRTIADTLAQAWQANPATPNA